MRATAPFVLLALASCGGDAPTPEVLTWSDASEAAPAPETFTWGGCSVEVVPPAGEWSRQRLQTSLEGVSFRMSRVPPLAIDLGIYSSLHRDHTVHSPASGTSRTFSPPAPDFTLADVVDRVYFDPDTLPPGSGVTVRPEEACSVDGWPAIRVDYTWTDRGHLLHCREVYFVADAYLFVARYSGPEDGLATFDVFLSTIRTGADATSAM